MPRTIDPLAVELDALVAKCDARRAELLRKATERIDTQVDDQMRKAVNRRMNKLAEQHRLPELRWTLRPGIVADDGTVLTRAEVNGLVPSYSDPDRHDVVRRWADALGLHGPVAKNGLAGDNGFRYAGEYQGMRVRVWCVDRLEGFEKLSGGV